MKNAEIARVLDEMADLLAMEEVEWKPRAYRRAARRLEQLAEPVEDVYERGELEAIDGVGEGIAERIAEYLETGSIAEHQERKQAFPVDIEALTRVEGLGPKRVQALYDALGIRDLDELEQAAREGRVAEVSGFGEKTQAAILDHIGMARQAGKRTLLGKAIPIVEDLVDRLEAHEAFEELVPVGSFRRRNPTIGDVDLLSTASDRQAAMAAFTELEDVDQVISRGQTKASIRLASSLRVDLRIVDPHARGAALLYFTGSKSHNIALRRRAQKREWKLNEYGLFEPTGDGSGEQNGEALEDQADGMEGDAQRLAGTEEQEIYEALDLAFIPPEMREDVGEIEAAERGAIPELVRKEQIRGDLQMHTEWSDGAASIQAMAARAGELGHDYILITDHGPDLSIAQGPDEDDIAEIQDEAQAATDATGVRVLVGIEANILEAGQLDVADELCAELDLVVAALHEQTPDATDRIVEALRGHPVDILAHPTNRRIGRREPNELNLDTLAKVCQDEQVALEVNAQPDRLDLPWRHIQTYRDAFAWTISTDAHSPGQLARMDLGVAQARKGWLTPEHVLNTRGVEEVLAHLRG